MTNLEQRLAKIEQRNARVELDKAWEGSLVRMGLLAWFTFLAIGLYLSAISVREPWLNAIVPSVGFMLSTLTLPFFKKVWVQRLTNKNKKDIELKDFLGAWEMTEEEAKEIKGGLAKTRGETDVRFRHGRND